MFSRTITAGKITKTSAHFIDLACAEDVDDDVRDWLTEAYVHPPAGGVLGLTAFLPVSLVRL